MHTCNIYAYVHAPHESSKINPGEPNESQTSGAWARVQGTTIAIRETNLEKGGYFEVVDADGTTNLEGGGYEEKCNPGCSTCIHGVRDPQRSTIRVA